MVDIILVFYTKITNGVRIFLTPSLFSDNQSFEGFPISLRVCREGLVVKQGTLLKLAIFLLDKMVCSVCMYSVLRWISIQFPWQRLSASSSMRINLGAKGGGSAKMIQGSVQASEEQICEVIR